MEAAGLVVGGAGLAGLFSACVQCLDMADLAKAQERALKVLHTKLENQKFFFIAWAQSIGLDGADEAYQVLRTLSPAYQERIGSTMQQVGMLFWEGQELKSRYGLETVVHSTADQAQHTLPDASPYRAMIPKSDRTGTTEDSTP